MRLIAETFISFVFFFVAWIGFCSQPAHAYLDPGTGSFMVQLLIGGFLAGVATIKLWWSKVVTMIKPRPKS